MSRVGKELQILSRSCRIDLCPEEGGGTVELVPGGRDIQVTESNVYDYVRKYAEHRMIKTQEKALEVRKFYYKYFGKLSHSIVSTGYSLRSV